MRSRISTASQKSGSTNSVGGESHTLAVSPVSGAPESDQLLAEHPAAVAEQPWETVVWDDPVNLMSYVSYVFRKHFGYSPEHAEALMLRVHHSGSAVVAQGAKSQMQLHVEAMHEYGLWATLRPQNTGSEHSEGNRA